MTTAKLSEKCKLDINELIATRMLVTANSGGGKSVTLRKIMEETYGKVQHIIIDIEGEFSSLREQFEYLLVGEEGEIPCEVKTAEILANKVMELKANVIIDLSDLKKNDRQLYVKKFLTALIHIPKELRNTALVFVDEAHHFAPESSKGKTESLGSVIDLMTRGRKRGLCGILSTQRISKLSKDAIAEAQNMMIGRIFLDIDQKRAGDTIGLSSREDVRSLRDLNQGEFYCVGSAFKHKGVLKTTVDWVKTSHPDRTKGILEKIEVPTPDKIKEMVKEIGDLPTEANKELVNLRECKLEVQTLRRKLRQAESSRPKPKYDDEKIKQMLSRAKSEGFNDGVKEVSEENKYLRQENDNFILLMKKIGSLLNFEPIPRKEFKKPENPIERFESSPKVFVPRKEQDIFSEEIKLKSGAIRILNFVAIFETLTKAKAKTLCGISSKGTFGSYLSDLKRAGYINIEGEEISITSEGLDFVGEPDPMPTSTEALIDLWSKHLKSGAIRMLRICVDIYPDKINRDDLQEMVGISSKGTFGSYLSDLKKNGLIKINGSDITASEELF